jgi:gas vesicle protein
MNDEHQNHRYPGFFLGLLTGVTVGAAVAAYLSPTIGREVRKRVAASAKDLGKTVSGYYEQASAGVVDAVEDLTTKSQRARNAAADVVARGAHEVARGAREVARSAHEIERFADAAKNGG